MVLSARNREVIPTVAYYQVPSTKEFDGLSIPGVYENITYGDNWIKHMEKHAKIVSILFCPFCKLEYLKLNGSYRLFFRGRVLKNKIKQEHFCILKNILQDCHNAMAAGSPTDLLIRRTDRPDIPDEDSTNKKNKQKRDDSAGGLFEAFFENIAFHQDAIDPSSQNANEDGWGLLKINSKVIRKIGTHGCGKHLTMETKVEEQAVAVHNKAVYYSITWDFNHTDEEFVCIASNAIFHRLKALVPRLMKNSRSTTPKLFNKWYRDSLKKLYNPLVYDPVQWIVSYLRDIGDTIYNDPSTIITLENLKNDLYYENVQKLQIEAKNFLYNIGGASSDVQFQKSISQLTYMDLFSLHGTKTEVVTTDGGVTIDADGSLGNIQAYAKIAFGSDKEQKVAFIHIVAAFIVGLYKHIKDKGVYPKQQKHLTNGQTKINFEVDSIIVRCIDRNKVRATAKLVDKNILQKLDQLNNEDNTDNLKWTDLDLPPDTEIAVEWIFLPGIRSKVKYREVETFDLSNICVERWNQNLRELENILNNKKQFIGFLTGKGGMGKSKVINSVRDYAKKLCNNLQVDFTSRTIVTTVVTGTAAVSINRETTCSAFNLKTVKDKIKYSKEFDDTVMVIIDEISFMGCKQLKKLNDHMNTKCNARITAAFGNKQMLFAGDFGQLPPVGDHPLYKDGNLSVWHANVNTFLELKTNHRFNNDPEWGELLERFSNDGPTDNDINFINSKIVTDDNEIPEDAIYGVYYNTNRTAINEGIFNKHLHKYHVQDIHQDSTKLYHMYLKFNFTYET